MFQPRSSLNLVCILGSHDHGHRHRDCVFFEEKMNLQKRMRRRKPRLVRMVMSLTEQFWMSIFPTLNGCNKMRLVRTKQFFPMIEWIIIEQWKKPFLFRVYRELYYPVIWGLLWTIITIHIKHYGFHGKCEFFFSWLKLSWSYNMFASRIIHSLFPSASYALVVDVPKILFFLHVVFALFLFSLSGVAGDEIWCNTYICFNWGRNHQL